MAMYQQYRDAANFYVVYIEEAHPTDLWQMSSNVKDGVLHSGRQRGNWPNISTPPSGR